MFEDILMGLLLGIAAAVFGFLFISVLLLIITPYALVAAAIQDGPYTSDLARTYRKSLRIFQNIWRSTGMSHRDDRDR